MFLTAFLTLLVMFCLQTLATVEDLHDQNFNNRISKYESAMVLFYAPWCHHCQEFDPTFKKASKNPKIEDSKKVLMAKIDCSGQGQKTCDEFGVKAYPTVKLFKFGRYVQEYEGPRDSSEISRYLLAQIGPSSRQLRSVSDLKEFLQENSNNINLVGFFEKGSSLEQAYFKAAEELRGKFNFAHTLQKELFENQGVDDGIVLYKPSFLCNNNKFEVDNTTIRDFSNSEDLTKIVLSNLQGLVGLRTNRNLNDFKDPILITYFNVDFIGNPEETNYIRNQVLEVAVKFQDQISFVISPFQDFSEELEELGLDWSKKTIVVVAKNIKHQKFLMKEEFSSKNLYSFVEKVLGNSLKPQEDAQSNTYSVKTLSNQNFLETLNGSTQDILILFYAPWCQEFLPVYEELAMKLQQEKVLFLKFDVTVNELPEDLVFDEYPAVYWIGRNKKIKPKIWTGKLSLEELLEFVAKHSTEELKSYDKFGKVFKDEL